MYIYVSETIVVYRSIQIKLSPRGKKLSVRNIHKALSRRGGGGVGGGSNKASGTEKRRSHNLQSDPLGSGFKRGRENFPF